MPRTLTALSFPILAFVSACSAQEETAQLPPAPTSLVLDLAFEDSCEPVSAGELTLALPPEGLAFGTGVEGRAVKFDGSGAAIELGGLDGLGIHSAMTLEFFVNAADWKNPYGAGSGLESMVSHSDVFTVAFDPSSWELQARLTTSAKADSLRLRGGMIRPGVWQHVALVYDNAAGKARLVLDGEHVAEVEVQGDVSVNPELDLVVGTWFQKNQAFCGSIDSIRLWSRALSAEELRARAAVAARARTSSS